VSAASRLKYCQLAYFSKPAAERMLYRTIQRLRPRRIFELGVGNAVRAARMISVALRHAPVDELRYAGVDLFEGRPAETALGVTLKDVHCRLKATGAKIQLIPGDPRSALARSANALRDNDLMLIAADQDAASLASAWFYMPRMLRADSVILRETLSADRSVCWQPISFVEIERLAAELQSRRRVA
jgi:hypothetical protein